MGFQTFQEGIYKYFDIYLILICFKKGIIDPLSHALYILFSINRFEDLAFFCIWPFTWSPTKVNIKSDLQSSMDCVYYISLKYWNQGHVKSLTTST